LQRGVEGENYLHFVYDAASEVVTPDTTLYLRPLLALDTFWKPISYPST
jgi:hypothetical protein